MLRFILLSLFVFLASRAQAQIVVQEESSVRRLLDIRRSANLKPDRVIRAWSVQIYIGRDKYETMQKLQEARSLLSGDLQTVAIDWEFDSPFYKVSAGAFYTKFDASTLLYQVQKHYPEAFIFKNNKVKPTQF